MSDVSANPPNTRAARDALSTAVRSSTTTNVAPQKGQLALAGRKWRSHAAQRRRLTVPSLLAFSVGASLRISATPRGDFARGADVGAQWKQKHREAAAAAKGKIFTKLAKEIAVAAKSGADPAMNATLRMAMEAARKQSMPRDTIERAVKKGAGLLDGPVNYETVTYEGFAPHQVPIIVECLTDNRNRTSANVRQLFKKGQLAASGAVSWDFARLGLVEAKGPAGADPEEAALECGADDLEPGEDGATSFYTQPSDADTVSKALTERGWSVEKVGLVWKAKNPVSLGEAERGEVEAFLGAMDEDDDVQNIFVGLA
jgi:YebC/PmpR family DNA-binding regulatory protein